MFELGDRFVLRPVIDASILSNLSRQNSHPDPDLLDHPPLHLPAHLRTPLTLPLNLRLLPTIVQPRKVPARNFHQALPRPHLPPVRLSQMDTRRAYFVGLLLSTGPRTRIGIGVGDVGYQDDTRIRFRRGLHDQEVRDRNFIHDKRRCWKCKRGKDLRRSLPRWDLQTTFPPLPMDRRDAPQHGETIT